MASYNLIDTKYRQMAFRSLSNDTPISPYEKSFGTPGQTKVSGDLLLFSSGMVGRWQKGDKILFSTHVKVAETCQFKNILQ